MSNTPGSEAYISRLESISWYKNRHISAYPPGRPEEAIQIKRLRGLVDTLVSMKLSDYVQNGENIVHQVSAIRPNSYDSTSSGTLACTDSRLIYIEGKTTTDIRIPSISSMAVKEPNYLNQNMVAGLLFAFTGVMSFVIQGTLPDDLALAAGVTGAAFLFVGAIGVATGIYYAKWKLSIAAGSKNLDFYSSDNSLVDIAHAIRGVE